MTTTSFEGVNNTSDALILAAPQMSKTSNARKIINTGASVGSPSGAGANSNLTRQIPTCSRLSPSTANDYSNAHWLVSEPKYLEINKGVLEKKRK